MSQSPKILFLVAALSLLLVIGVIYAKHQQSMAPRINTANVKTQVFDVASGDTNNETLRTIAARQLALENENKALQKSNKRNERDRIRKNNEELTNLKHAFGAKLTALKNEFSKKLRKQDEKKGTNEKKSNSDYPVGGFKADSHLIGTVSDISEDRIPVVIKEDGRPSLPSSQDGRAFPEQKNKKDQKRPFYTIPANSTLNHTSLMTSIIAQVPVSGRLVEPAFPFKAILGKRDLFAANGISIPSEIAGIVIEGYSVGNMTLSCARGYVTKVLFVFNDGHFVVYPEKNAQESRTELFPKDALGYLSDEYGNTCISGKYITDAPKVIANLSLLEGVSHLGSGIAQLQTETLQNAFETSTKITGSATKYMAGNFVAGATSEAKEWYKKRVAEIFDAVIIPATVKDPKTGKVHITQVTFNVTKTIPIDLNAQGRKLRYEEHSYNVATTDHLD